MILLKNGRIKMVDSPSLQHLTLYEKCLRYLIDDMRDNGVHTTAHMLEIAIATLSEKQTHPPISLEEEDHIKKTRKKLKKAINSL